jgi:hypothetical protein
MRTVGIGGEEDVLRANDVAATTEETLVVQEDPLEQLAPIIPPRTEIVSPGISLAFTFG